MEEDFSLIAQNLVGAQSVFDGFVIDPRIYRDTKRGERKEFFEKGVVFDLNLNFGNSLACREALDMIGLDKNALAEGKRADFFKPTTFEELITCLQNTCPEGFIKYVCGEKTTINLTKLINSFVQNNLEEKPDDQAISGYTEQVYSVIMDDKAPKYYLTRINNYNERIRELESNRESFIRSYVGSEPSEQDYAYVQERMASELGSEQEVVANNNLTNVESIVQGVILSRRTDSQDTSSNLENCQMDPTP